MSEENKQEPIIKSFPFITGETIDLVAGSVDMAPLVCRWMNDPKVRRFSRNAIPHSLDEIKKWFEPPSDRRTPDFIVMNIWHKKDNKPIGSAGINRINWLNRTANAFLQIGETDYWGQGIASEATRLMLQYAFEELNLNKIQGRVAVDNIGSWKVAEKLGFIHECTMKEEFYVDGKYVDVKYYRFLKNDWVKQKQSEKNNGGGDK